MAVFDTHSAFNAFRDAGFSEEQSQALIDAGRDGTDALATKADLKELEAATKDDLKALEAATKADLKALEAATKADLKALEVSTNVGLRDLEQRMTIRLGAMMFATTGLQVAIVAVLLVLVVR